MKPNNRTLQHWIPLFGLALACSTGSLVAATDYLVCDFDTSYCTVNRDNGPAPALDYWTNTVGNPGGSAYLVINWADNAGGWQDTKLSWDLPWPGADCPNYVNVEFDVMIDQPNSFPATDGNYGGVQIVCQGWQGWGLNVDPYYWSPIGGAGLAATPGWQHVVIPLASFPHTLSRVCLNFYGNPPSATTNTISYFVDNLKLTIPPAAPPTLGIQMRPAPQPGLNVFASQGGGQFQRQSIRTTGTSYSWYNMSGPTTYSFTIADFPAAGTTNYAQNYDTGISGWEGWWGLTPTFSWDSTTPDAGGRCANGSLRVSIPFAGAGGEQTSFRGLFPAQLDGTKYETLSFDIKVDPSSGPITSGANYGTFDGIGFVAPDYSQVTVGQYTVPLSATSWTHVSLAINRTAPKLNGIRGFWFKMWSDNAHTNALTFLLDNVQLQAVGSSFQAHMFLVPGPRAGTEASPDWNETNCFFVQIQADGNGQAAGVFRYKTNFPSSNGGTNVVSVTTNANCVAVTNINNYFSACQLGNITNGPVVGTWSLTFSDNTNVTFSGPGATTNFTIPDEVLSAMFANADGTMLVYYGIDPNNTNYIGQRAVLSRAVVTNENFAPSIDDPFSAPALDTTLWTISADDPGGVFIVPTGSKGWLTWTIPDAGFTLQGSTDLMDPNSWGAPALYTFINNNVRQALIGPVYDTEMTQLAMADGSLPVGLLIRESPTKASLGQTTIFGLSGGNFRIASSFELYTEVSTDSGATWFPATNGPAPLSLNGVFAANTLPPSSGQYVTTAPWQGLYANGVVISNLVLSAFDNSFPPDQTPENFNASADVMVSTDAGATFTPANTMAPVSVQIGAGVRSQRFFRLMKPGS